MVNICRYIFFIFILLFTLPSQAQVRSATIDTIRTKKSSLIGFPIIFYQPETKWGFGGLGSYTFRFKGEADNTPSSQVQLGFAYTLRNQLLFYLPFRLHWKDDEYRSYGEIGYYKYLYDFFGIGNQAGTDDREVYHANYPRLRLNFMKKIRPHLYGGVRYWMDDYDIVQREANGLLENESVTGSQGGFLSGAGLIFNYDKRDDVYSATSGLYGELVVFDNSKRFGSDFDFSKIFLDLRAYRQNKWGHVMAVNSFIEFTGGDAPFSELAKLGGTKKMRGYVTGRYRENHMFVFQGEYRAHLFWRIGVVGFASVGTVTNRIVDLHSGHFRLAGGAGLRVQLTEKERINLRIDAGFGKNTKAFYVTIGEAF